MFGSQVSTVSGSNRLRRSPYSLHNSKPVLRDGQRRGTMGGSHYATGLRMIDSDRSKRSKLAMLDARAGKPGRGRWARRTGAASLALVAAATWMAVCSDDPAGIRGDGDLASLTVTPLLAEPVAVGGELGPAADGRDACRGTVAKAVVSVDEQRSRALAVRSVGWASTDVNHRLSESSASTKGDGRQHRRPPAPVTPARFSSTGGPNAIEHR